MEPQEAFLHDVVGVRTVTQQRVGDAEGEAQIAFDKGGNAESSDEPSRDTAAPSLQSRMPTSSICRLFDSQAKTG
jgi:hypothetical protein